MFSNVIGCKNLDPKTSLVKMITNIKNIGFVLVLLLSWPSNLESYIPNPPYNVSRMRP